MYNCFGILGNRELHQLLRRFYPVIKIPAENFDIFLETAEILQKDKANFLKLIEREKNPEGFFYIHKSTGVVVCHK